MTPKHEIRLKVPSDVKAKLRQLAAERFTTEASVVSQLIMGIATVVPKSAEPPKKKKPVPGTDAHLRWTLDLPPKGRICAEDRSVYATALARHAAEAINPVNP